MSTATAPAQPGTHADLGGIRLSFVRLIRSEWIKLRSVRSTVWCFGILFLLNIGFPLLVASVGNFGAAQGAHVSADTAGAIGVTVITLGVNFTSLVVAVLGVLIISGEYSTGMIRGTFTADPRRFGALFAKTLVLAITTFVVTVVSTWIAAIAAHPILANKGIDVDLSDSKVFLPILGSSVYVTLIALLAFGVGTLVRTTAGGIAITLGALLVAPIILTIVGGLVTAHWPADINAFMPSQAGGQLFSYDAGSAGGVGAGPGGDAGGAGAAATTASGVVTLNGWEGFGVLGAEVVAVSIAAFVLVKRRDA